VLTRRGALARFPLFHVIHRIAAGELPVTELVRLYAQPVLAA
jgi:hypothetical protein